MPKLACLPGVSEDYLLSRFSAAGGNEVESGKFASPESSAALAANVFGWFHERPEFLPPFPGLEDVDWPATSVEVEESLRFPWSGGRHPWLDVVVMTKRHLIGIESKRFEPFRDKKTGTFSDTYWRPVWGRGMKKVEAVRDSLTDGTFQCEHLDAVQLVKHALGIVTEAKRRQLKPVLAYVFAEPRKRDNVPIAPEKFVKHRREIEELEQRIAGAKIRFVAFSYREWISGFDGDCRAHAQAIVEAYTP